MTTLTGARPAPDPYAAAQQAADALRARTGVERHDVVVVLGSGWLPAVEELGAVEAEIGVGDLPGFVPPAAAGHAGLVRSLRADGQRVLVFLGRTHLYEGHGVAAVTHAVRTAAAAGCGVAVLTNGCGSLREDWTPGRAVLIADHLNLTATSPLCGARFVDLTALYTPRLRSLCRAVTPALAEGVYAQLPGPHYETPAEIRMLRAAGADLVGMSTTLEAIAAREAGMEVLGISLVTNLAAGMTGRPLDHAEVLRTGSAAASAMGRLLCGVLPGV